MNFVHYTINFNIRDITLISISALLISCSPANERTNQENIQQASNSESYTKEKREYCAGTEDAESCSCQFDVMNPILTENIGSDWSTKAMEEKDFPTYTNAVEEAVRQCP